jgi:serine protease
MRHFSRPFLSAATIAVGVAAVVPLRASAPDHVPAEVIVAFRTGTDARDVERTLGRTRALRAERGLSGRRYRVTLDPSASVEGAVRQLASLPEVEYAEPNGFVYLNQVTTFRPNDRFYNIQWNFRMMVAERMWAIQKGSPSVGVAVLDSGVAYEDYVDPRTGQAFRRAPDWGATAFLPGFDFVNSDAHPNDDHYHGTHVASVIAEATNNGEGLTGIAFNCPIMPVKVVGANGVGNFFDLAEGIDYAAGFSQAGVRPVRVINMSLGADQASSAAVESAVSRATASGIVLVASAGNDNNPRLLFPASIPAVIAVGAVDQRKQRARYSNYARGILYAPGGDIFRDDDGDGVADGIFQQTLSPELAQQGRYDVFQYRGFNGTSAAAPHVAALAALLISQGITDPRAVRAALESAAEDLGAPGDDEVYGKGLIRPVEALTGMGLNR